MLSKKSERSNAIEVSPEKLPQTTFEQADTKMEAELANYFLENKSWVGLFKHTYPELIKIQADAKEFPTEEKIARYKEFFDKIHNRDKSVMIEFQERLGERWEGVAMEFLSTLSSHFETAWPEDQKITGYISALPIYPRFLKDYSFCVGYDDLDKSIETCAHEIVHFLWFKKWKEVFPEMDVREYDSPHLAWRLSEIMDPIILQCHPRIKELINPVGWGYSSFDKVKIGDISMTEQFKRLYLDCVSRGDSFGDTIKKLYEEAKVHSEEISKF